MPAQPGAVSARPSGVTTASGPRINVDHVLATGPSGGAPGALNAPATSDNRDAQEAYFGNLLSRLRAAHEKPAGLSDALQTQVEFVLRSNGTVSDVRILKSSGDEAFDASVLAAFKRLRDLGVPPVGSDGINRVIFRVQEK
ncbi:MAG: energy transducer TonB [Rariglobus sp.]